MLSWVEVSEREFVYVYKQSSKAMLPNVQNTDIYI
jgi:hypothetical protein